MKKAHYWITLLFLVFLVACGGGGGGGSDATNASPVADAGPDQTVAVGTTVELDGSGSTDPEGELLDFYWALVSAPSGSSASLSDSAIVNPQITADIPGIYEIDLFVSDGVNDSPSDSVTITASVANVPPVAEAGINQNVTTGSLVTLDGSGSSDANGDSLVYSWYFSSVPTDSAAVISGADTFNPSFTTDVDGTYTVTLTVNDGEADSTPDVVTIVASTANAVPVSNAGIDQNVSTGSIVTLNGSGSSDADGDTLTYSWAFTTIPLGSSATLSNNTAINPTFTADLDGTYVLSLVVSDSEASSAPDTVTITSNTVNSAPVADAGPDVSVPVGSLVILDASGSTDADGDTLTYSWSVYEKPCNSAGIVLDETSVQATIFIESPGSYAVTVVARDSNNETGFDTMIITANEVAPVAYPIQDSGQTLCYDQGGLPIACAGTGQDGEIVGNTMSFTDNGDGTVTDNVTDLIWMQDESVTPYMWSEAGLYCATLELAGYDDWRLPTLNELRGILDYGSYQPAIDPIFSGGSGSGRHWASTSPQCSRSWAGYLNEGEFQAINNTSSQLYTRCVR